MALLLSCQSVAKSFGGRVIFQNLSLTVSDGERLGLIGPNGAGKSTMLQILAGTQTADEGVVSYRKGVRLGYVPQDSEFAPEQTVEQILLSAIAIEPGDEYEHLTRVGIVLGKVGFTDTAQPAGTLSGGWRKRLAIAQELLRDPELLLLDEPTNHLDLDGILWLEKLLQSASFASVTVSHDRYFLDNVANAMIEVNRSYPDGLLRVNGNYTDFLEKQADFLHAQSRQQEALENLVRREVEWLRRGAKARTSKSKARIDNAGRLMDELSAVNERSSKGTASIDFTASDRKTKRLISVEGLQKRLGDRALFDGLSFVLAANVRLGLVGGNGSGKSTLLRLLRGDLTPDGGEVRRADGLRVVFFEQNRTLLDPRMPLRQALAPDGDSVIFREQTIHVAAWAKRFLFREEQLGLPVEKLSGGERARVLIADLMRQPADVLLLDEPTNDLDIPTLEVLEENLLEFPGALVLVTHDRFLLDRVSTTVLGLDGEGDAQLFADYSQWEAYRAAKRAAKVSSLKSTPVIAAAAVPKKKLSYLEQREFDGMEEKIASAEAALAAKQQELVEANQQFDSRKVHEAYTAVESAQASVDVLYARWAELEAKLASVE